MHATVGDEPLGREKEIAEGIDALDPSRLPAVVVLRGEAGIGKTTVWRAIVSAAAETGFGALTSRPAESETQLSYAGLRDLFEPLTETQLGQLPSPQRRALEVALLRAEAGGAPPDQAAIAYASLGALRAAAGERPVLVAVDDVQWLDAPSSYALRFAARRLRDEPVGLLVAVREASPDPPQPELGAWLPEERTRKITLGPLTLGALHRLLLSRLGVALPRPVLRRLHESTQGNPLFALEMARAVVKRDEPVVPGEPLPVPGELRELLRHRLDALPTASFETLLLAAALSQPTLPLLEDAAGADARSLLEAAAASELIELEGSQVRFRHPLFASAVYAKADLTGRRAAHRRLADVVSDPEERARHLALSTQEPDRQIAVELDVAARLARARGAPQAAAELSEHAFGLTPAEDLSAAHRRRLDAGAAHFAAGNTPRAQALFAEAADEAPAGPRRAEALSRLARLHHYSGDQRLAVRLFRDALADAESDRSVHVDAAEGLATALFFLRRELDEALEHARYAATLAEQGESRAALAAALGTQGVLEAVLGRSEATRTLEAALAFERATRDLPVVRRPSFQLAFVRVWIDELDAARDSLEAVRQEAFEHGDEGSLPFVLTYLSLADWISGRWTEAMHAAEDGAEIALAAGQGIGRAFALSARALVAASCGLEGAARSDAVEAIKLAEQGSMFATTTSSWALALLELSLDHPRGASEALRSVVDRCEAERIGEPGAMRFVPDEIEALIWLGDCDRAAARLRWFEGCAAALGRRSALAAALRCKGLLALAAGASEEALAYLVSAVEGFDSLHLPFERTRTLLALGSAQRRAGRRRAGRESLEEARVVFEELGATLWAARAKQEFQRISGRMPARGELTASERRVAELVAEGRTNREVAAELYVTPRTVEGTLSRVYAKLGIRSRTELARRWSEGQS
jgi:DNA-binding CsgD family transcriptional regulator